MEIINALQLDQFIQEHPYQFALENETIQPTEKLKLKKIGQLFDSSIGNPSSISFHHPDHGVILIGCFPWVEGEIMQNLDNNELVLKYKIGEEEQYHGIDPTKTYIDDPVVRRFVIPRSLKYTFLQATSLFELNYAEMIERYRYQTHNEEVVYSKSPLLFNYNEDIVDDVPCFMFDIVSTVAHLQSVQKTLTQLSEK